MKTAKYTLEITFPDDETMDENLLQKVILNCPKLEDCLVWVYKEENKNKLRNIAEMLKKSNIPLRELDNMISVLEKQQDYATPEDVDKIEQDIERIMEHIEAHYEWCTNCNSYFEGYNGLKKNVELYGEYLCNACVKSIKPNVRRKKYEKN